jgi:hypothetical protein
MAEWWAELFDERYLQFYDALRPPRPSLREADFVMAALDLGPGARVLDLGSPWPRAPTSPSSPATCAISPGSAPSTRP